MQMVAKELLEQYTGMEPLSRMLGTLRCLDKGFSSVGVLCLKCTFTCK